MPRRRAGAPTDIRSAVKTDRASRQLSVRVGGRVTRKKLPQYSESDETCVLEMLIDKMPNDLGKKKDELSEKLWEGYMVHRLPFDQKELIGIIGMAELPYCGTPTWLGCPKGPGGLSPRLGVPGSPNGPGPSGSAATL